MIKTTSYVPAPRETVWDFVTSPEGINYELMPVVRMTVPRGLRRLGAADIREGERLGRSWILALGLIPFDYDDIFIAELEPGYRFLETSRMLSMCSWRHERTLADWGTGCKITDEVSFELRAPLARVPGSNRFVRGLVGRVFAHRHRRLYGHFYARGN